MKRYYNLKYPALLLLLLGSGLAQAQNQPLYIDGVYNISDGEQWYANVELGPNAQVYVPDGAKVYFYGAAFKVDAGARIYGASGATAPAMTWTTTNLGSGTGLVTFHQPNPMDASSVQQTLNGGNPGTSTPTTANTFTGLELDNSNGVSLINTATRVGSNILFTNGNLLLGTQDAYLAADATLSGYSSSKYVVTASSGHLVKENFNTLFVFPVGFGTSDYTPATLTPSASNTIHVNVSNYATSAPLEHGNDGMDRSWNIYGDNSNGALITLQHNSVTNQSAWNTAANFVTQYGTSPNTTGDFSPVTIFPSAWQSNTPSASSTSGGAGTETQSRSYTALAVSGTANESWFSKASNFITPLPLELTSFTAKSYQCDALLNWTVAYVAAGAYFVIERSTDGTVFSPVATVSQQQNNNNYSYTDENALQTSCYYKLRIAEPGEANHYSETKRLQACSGEAIASFTLAPSPVRSGQAVNILYNGPVTGASYRLFNAAGQMLRSSGEFQIGGTAGAYATIPTDDLGKGIYIVSLINEKGHLIGNQKLMIY